MLMTLTIHKSCSTEYTKFSEDFKIKRHTENDNSIYGSVEVPYEKWLLSLQSCLHSQCNALHTTELSNKHTISIAPLHVPLITFHCKACLRNPRWDSNATHLWLLYMDNKGHDNWLHCVSIYQGSLYIENKQDQVYQIT